MPYTSVTDLADLPYLRDYASYIKKNKLEDLVSSYLMNVHAFKIPLLQLLSHLSEEQLLQSAREGVLTLLTGIETATAIDEVRQTLSNWKNNQIPGIAREAISLKDITLLYFAQKTAFQSFLPYYTSDVAVATQLVSEIELYFKQVQQMALEMLETIRREEEEKRLETEEKYRDLFDNASDLIHIADPAGTILYVNNAWLNTLGYQYHEIRGKAIYNFVKDSEQDYFNSYRRKIIDEKATPKILRTRLVKSNGDEITVEGFISCKYKNDTPEYTRGILRDITSKLKQEQKINFYLDQLAEREENLRQIIQQAPDAVLVIDQNNTIILWNPKAEEIFGWTREEVIGRDMSDIIAPKAYRERHNAGMKRYLETRKPNILNNTVEVPALHKDGHEFFISLTVSNSKQSGKDIFIAFIRDITDARKNQVELDKKRKQLEKSNEELEQYAWLTSHDLKEPLRKILTFSDALISKYNHELAESAQSYLNKIHKSAERMSELIEAVLTYSNVGTDRDLFTQTDINTIYQDVLEDLEMIIQSKRAVVESDSLPVIEAIPIQMRQLLQNLLSNALKYSKPGVPPVIKVICRKTGSGYMIAVKDNGTGFESMYAEKIFQVFQRLSHNKAQEGTGIGLALCKKIAEAHHGSIWAESQVGVGSTFFVQLPKSQSVTPLSA